MGPLLLAAWLTANGLPAYAEEIHRFEVAKGEASAAIHDLGTQAGLQILVAGDRLQGRKLNAVSGQLSTEQALMSLLDGSGLTHRYVGERSVALLETPAESREAADDSSLTEFTPTLRVPEVLVVGSRMLNTDIPRTIDDPQPYVIFNREVIEQSGAVDVNDFLKNRLTMNSAGASAAQSGNSAGAISGVNLRGLGENQTLILIDGRRAAKTSTGFTPGQADLNTIPLAAIERIEVLPTTASAIYGGAATGGVVNIILRRDYQGLETSVTYDNSFDGDASKRRVDFAGGMNFLEGRTNVLLSGSYSDANHLQVKDRDFLIDGRRRQLANNPAVVASRAFPFAGATANIVSANGQPLVLDNGTPLGSTYTSASEGYAGVASDGGAALLANAGQYNLGFNAGAQFGVAEGNASLVPASSVKAFSGTLRHEFSSKLRAFVEASVSENTSRSHASVAAYGTLSANSPVNPFQQPITIIGSTEQFNGMSDAKSAYERFGTGLIYRLPGDWTASLDYTYTEAEISYRGSAYVTPAFAAAMAAGTLDITRDLDAAGVDLSVYTQGLEVLGTPIKSTTKNPALRLSGPIGTMWAGSPQLSLLLEQQDLEFGAGEQVVLGGTYAAFFPERTQNVDSAYVEMRVPLVAAKNDVPWVRELELQLAARWDRYQSRNANYVLRTIPGTIDPPQYFENDVDDVNPLVAFRYRPNTSIALRASYGTGFIPPEINQLTAPLTSSSTGIYIDPRRGNTGPVGSYQLSTGGNPDLQPESSISWSVGLILTPTWVDGLRLSVDYTNIKKEDNITSLTAQQLIDNESSFPGRITRGANLPADPAGWAGPITAIDRTSINSAWAQIETYDLQLDYALPRTRVGRFSVFALATWLETFDTQLVATLPALDQAGVAGSVAIPVEFKANAGITWSSDRWTLGWTSRYIDSYYVANPTAASSAVTFLSQGNGGKVKSQIYHDLFGKISFSSDAGGVLGRVLDGLEVQAGVRNVFNKSPPYDVSNGFQYYSFLADPRLATYYITLKQSF
jgi:outer membrane receptor protein involved in Fe transport